MYFPFMQNAQILSLSLLSVSNLRTCAKQKKRKVKTIKNIHQYLRFYWTSIDGFEWRMQIKGIYLAESCDMKVVKNKKSVQTKATFVWNKIWRWMILNFSKEITWHCFNFDIPFEELFKIFWAVLWSLK